MRKTKGVVVSVSNDLVTDRRVMRSCKTLTEEGFEVLLVGRKLPASPELSSRPYRCLRMKLLFNKGPLFYACLNLRLFFLLLFRPASVLMANDLDTMPANVMVSMIKRIPLIYDSHEYFTGVPELQHRPRVQRIWKRIERFCLPYVHSAMTVNQSIAALYKQEYDIRFSVVRNLPEAVVEGPEDSMMKEYLPDTPFILLQGNGINVDRGGEEAVLAMHHVQNAKLVILGAGDVIPVLKDMVKAEKLESKVCFIPRRPPEFLLGYTRRACLGLSLDKPSSINQQLSLPNKLFDYIMAGVPVIATALPEVERIVNAYGTGKLITELTPRNLADTINQMLADEEALVLYRQNCHAAANELNWGKEKRTFISIFEPFKT